MNRPHRILLCALVAMLPLLLCSCLWGPCGPIWSSTKPRPEEPPLSASQYDAAELVYRTVLPGGKLPDATTNFVYCLSFGNSERSLPDDFMARFANDSFTVRTDDKGIAMQPAHMVQPAPGKDYELQTGGKYDVATGRHVVEITFYWAKFDDTRARARLYYASRTEDLTEVIYLTKEHGQWTVTAMNEVMRETD
jgi:hypothetical protein